MRKRQTNGRKLTAVEQADLEVAEHLAPFHDSLPVRAVGPIAEMGDQPPLYALTGGVILAGIATRDWRLTHGGARMMAAHVAATVLKTILKRCVDRTRPARIAKDGAYKLGKGRRYETEYNSFPSGHTASSVAVAQALGRAYPGLSGAALGAAGTIAGLQVIRSKHFPSDIVAGAAIGLAAEKAVDLIFRHFPARP
jgi:membrane-associated phospholipid phosphatase